jgi:diadenylate cyclase
LPGGFPLVPAIEIALMAAAFYAILRFIRGTRGAGVLRGALVFFVTVYVAVLWVTEKYQLLRIQRILEWVLSTSLLALVVIFWPELRRALIRLGELQFFRPLLRTPAPSFLGDIAGAAERLAQRRYGALLAVERDMSLAAYAEDGVPVDAAVSPELLETLFFPRSALHDGAVILQHGRVLAAACLLPLTEAPNLSKSLGTRHRAAIGLTEETDAVVVVVSEETGQISVAVRGTLTANVEPGRLRPLLEELYTGARNEGAPEIPASARAAAPAAEGGARPAGAAPAAAERGPGA